MAFGNVNSEKSFLACPFVSHSYNAAAMALNPEAVFPCVTCHSYYAAVMAFEPITHW
jgi:hypothetical protein